MYLPSVLRCNLQFTLKFVWVFFEEGKKSPSIDKGILGAEVSLQGARLCRRRAWGLLTGFWSWLVLHKSLRNHSWLSGSSASLHASGSPAGCLVGGVWKYAPEAASPPQTVISLRNCTCPSLDAEYAPFIVHRDNWEKDISEWSNKSCWRADFLGTSLVWRTGSCCLSGRCVFLVCTQKRHLGDLFLPERRDEITVNRSIQKLLIYNKNTSLYFRSV